MTDAGPAGHVHEADRAARQHATERITVGLICKAMDGLQTLKDRTGLSKTDIVNRAIPLYEFVSDQIDAGHDVIIRNAESGEIQILRLF